MNIQHPKLVKLLQLAYSAEKAAAFAYIGHAGSVKNPDEKLAIRQIELDEWQHRETVLSIMRQHAIAFPLIGAGSGSFNQDRSKALMLDELSKLDVQMTVKIVVFKAAK